MRICFFLLYYCSISFAQTPFVSNINLQQQGNDKIVITYDLAGNAKDHYDVMIERIEIINFPKGIVPKSLTGDIGKNISAGKNKSIVWDVLKDIEYLDKDIKVVMRAIPIYKTPNDKPKNNKLLVRLGASTLSAGGSTLVIWGINKMKEGKTFYNNYASTTDPTKFQQDFGMTRSDALVSSKMTYSKGRTLSIAGGGLIAVGSFFLVKQKLSKNTTETRFGFVPTSDGNFGFVYRF
ncbi:MAG: hypothetical protein JNL70_06190 [Saprospiraceae bacterium]|nr:hypothetical protein [Saprospiraceae bacterium]